MSPNVCYLWPRSIQQGPPLREGLVSLDEEGDVVGVGLEGLALVEAVDGAGEFVVGIDELLGHGAAAWVAREMAG